MKNAGYLKSYNGGILTISDEDVGTTTHDCSNCQLYKELCSKDKGNDKICEHFFDSLLNKDE